MGGDKLKRILFKGDKVIWVVFITLCAISWVEVFSATSRQTYASGNYWSPIIKHSGFLVGGIFVAWFIHNLKAQWIDKFSKTIYWLGFIGLLWAQFMGTRLNDSARWISIMGITFQPMEIAKMGLVMMTARILAKNQDEDGTNSRAFVDIIKYSVLPVALILKENFSSAFILSVTIFLMMFVGRVPKRLLLRTLGVGFVLGAIGITAVMMTPESVKSSSFGSKVITWQHRIKDAFNSKPVTAEEYDENENEQKTYSHIAVASSHLIGCGPGNSIQRDFIPHAYSDYIFAVIIEELGLLGAIGVMLLYLTLLYSCGKIAKKCDDPYTAFLSMGIGMIIVMQALLHMYISVGNFVTGQPLPLMSQGGTSFLINSIYVGFLLCISRYANAANDKKNEQENIV
ncbi:MAG: FtsW/RodA/SpoVE family cell cycle protein [Bacteroidaceae bacterium]|nr:FtsW/RodA/SpoVE family cell cycle protein [Bacteroidaceae bacterium]MBR4966638.1 FtsW/RodA/SpoVE family cell cycle protein [Bacteroidaceae bacterium]